MKNMMNIRLECPWCHKGETLASGKAKIKISIVCHKCGRYYTADLNTIQTECSTAYKRNK